MDPKLKTVFFVYSAIQCFNVLSSQRGPFYLQCFRWSQGENGAVNDSVERGRKCEVADRVGKG